MSVVEPVTTSSLRQHPQLQAIFKAAECRYFSDQEFEEYLSVAPENADRVKAAKEMRAVEEETVSLVVEDIFAVYPYTKYHAGAQVKANRDIRNVGAYGTAAMLMNDPQWFSDKLLIWLKTILQSFEFPDRESPAKKAIFGSTRGDSSVIDKLKPHQRPIYATYVKLKSYYQERLTQESFALMEPYLQLAIDTLAFD